MAFDNDHPNRKDWRRPYRGAAAHTMSCRPGRGCPWCEGNRTIRTTRAETAAEDDLLTGLEEDPPEPM